jgi:phenylpyruvate tautomerase PptA (4-oxalocrotonate tautomerase family)
MPFVHTYVHANTSTEKRALIVDAIHQALVSSIGMPVDELFNLVHAYDPANFYYSRSFNGIERSDYLVVVEITLRRGRSDAMKKDLYNAVAQNVSQATGQSTSDVFIYMHENDYSDWSVGNGVFAMALVQQRGGVLLRPAAS